MDDSGFTEVTRLGDARERLREVCDGYGRTEQCTVAEGAGRILAEPVTANRAVPHYDKAAMDGYAVRGEDTFAAGSRSPVELSVAEREGGTGLAVPVDTGNTVPESADAVVLIERTERRGDSVLVSEAVATGENVAPAGEDVEEGSQLFDAGDHLRPSDLALLRSTDLSTVACVEPPSVCVLPTGEELVEPDVKPAAGELVETNGLVVSTLADQWGGAPTYGDIVPDDERKLREAIESGTDHDTVVTTGGSSVGERDLVADVVDNLGDVLVHGIATKPGYSAGFGVVEETPIIMLPGSPVSCLVNAVQFLRPAIAWQSNTAERPQPTTRGTLTTKLPSSPGERTFARVRVRAATEGRESVPDVEPVGTGGAGIMSSVSAADGWVEIPESREGIPAGETVTVQEWEYC